MCICFYTLEHPKYSLVLISNRDEFMARPTERAHWYEGRSNGTGADSTRTRILSGVDVTGGGTWFGVEATSGRFGLLTNVREEASTWTRSRGKLVSDWLESIVSQDGSSSSSSSTTSSTSCSVQEYLRHLEATMREYAGFNLFLGRIANDGQVEMGFLSNRSQHIHTNLPKASSGPEAEAEEPANGACCTTSSSSRDNLNATCTVHIKDTENYGVMSNGALACGPGAATAGALDRAWPKMEIGQKAFQEHIVKYKQHPQEEVDRAKFVQEMFEVLNIEFPNLKDKEDVRSTILVPPFDMFPPHQTWYATREQTVLLVERGEGGKVHFAERQAFELDAEGVPKWSGASEDWSFQVGS